MRSTTPGKDKEKFGLSINKDLKNWVINQAEKQGQSASSYIENLIKDSQLAMPVEVEFSDEEFSKLEVFAESKDLTVEQVVKLAGRTLINHGG